MRYLESRLIKIARAANRCDLRNGTDHFYANLPAADKSDMEFFVEQIQRLLPVLGFAFLRPMPKVAAPASQNGLTAGMPAPASPIFVGDIKKHGIAARAQEVDGEFVVMKDFKTRLHWDGVRTSYTRLFKDLVKPGVLSPQDADHHNIFTKDDAFTAPSEAVAMVAERIANGRTHWTVQGTNKTYGEWQDEQVTKAAAQASASATSGCAPKVAAPVRRHRTYGHQSPIKMMKGLVTATPPTPVFTWCR